jgi:TIR domain
MHLRVGGRLRPGIGRGGHWEARFFEDLSDHVDELMGLPTGQDPGYMDESMHGGEVWSDDVHHALSVCRVFVPLVSMEYARSEWCEREWTTFAQRRVRRIGHDSAGLNTGMLPVLWSPLGEGFVLPAWLSSVQYFRPRHPEDESVVDRYFAHGLYGLKSISSIPTYEIISWRLALRIRDLCLTYDVEPLAQGPDWVPPETARGGDR